MNKITGDIVKKYLDQYPNIANLTLAKLIYKENNAMYSSVESVRSLIRKYKGSSGNKALKEMANTKYLTENNYKKKYNLPTSIETIYEPYKIITPKALIFSDTHLLFQSNSAIETMFDYTKNNNIESVILLGDIMDCFEVSVFSKEPNLCSIKDEIEMTKKFLEELKKVYPKSRIFYKFGNHEKRMDDYIKIKAPELFGIEAVKLHVLLDLYNMGINYIEENRYIDMGGLYLYHGHEFKNGITSPANPARTAFLRSKDCAMVAHHHQTSEHTEKSINDKVITCWSLGCMSELHPAYNPLNKFNHGFAIYERYDKEFWNIKNYRIIRGRVV
jgi:predicted phosphodiesterase